uniref:Uncharacterized protein n=1 Tax=Cucumis melo TaxID=3656 RepID=A0A9I9E6U9_CUCME
MNMTNVLEAKIKVRENLSDLLSATIELKDEVHGNIFLNFDDIKVIKEPAAIQNTLFIRDFTNPVDLVRIDQALKDEGIDSQVLKPEWAFLNSTHSKPAFARNPFNHGQCLQTAQACPSGEPSSSRWNSSPAALKLKKKFKLGGNNLAEVKEALIRRRDFFG